MSSFLSAAIVAQLLQVAVPALAATTVTVSATASHAIPSTLWGMMFEDISHSGDGGLYAELIQNRAFQQVAPDTAAALDPWVPLGDSQISVVADSVPLSSALPNSLALTVPAASATEIGFANPGYFGIGLVKGTAYSASLNYRVAAGAISKQASLTISLLDQNNKTLAAFTTPLRASGKWTEVTASLVPSHTPPSNNNSFAVTVTNARGAESQVNFALLSLFPPTFKGRANGMRPDIAETLAANKPAFWRFPGGNNLEGQTVATRWQWNNTVGPLKDRPGRVGDWGYVNTDGLGLLEYLHWCEDLDMEPYMAVWDGYTLGGTNITGAALDPYIAQAIDQINFVIGDPATSAPAALRASLGHPEPFTLHYVEIGNEDFFDDETVANRWNTIVTNLSATFPQLTFMATSLSSGPVLTPTPKVYDVHVYSSPTYFATNSFLYDSVERNGTHYFEGEYAAISTNDSNLFGTPAEGRLLFPTVASAVGEAAFMTGFERNADIVFSASYAPLLGSVNDSQWTPNLVGFDASNVYKSTSYYVQNLFANNKGDEYLPSTLPSNSSTATLLWSVTRSTANKEVIIKISNNAATTEEMKFVLPFKDVSSTGSATVLTGPATASNTPDAPDAIVPVTSRIKTGTTFEYTAPAVSFSVLVVSAH
ncbi:Alpha-L-AF-C domain-containing protein [Mycena chlorophos]|uniref:non-reducing end alpha-L-arabinofuranosidase n=1 Tax=Mycena chlorophos TaxID=658473 RepID=A0A8H6TGI9_MYCCL|nr:Alpha-L-AF-C domain-containing protein [Mycena chlorophos]